MKKRTILRYVALGAIAALAATLLPHCSGEETPATLSRDYDAIAQEGILRVTTEYNPINFYANGDETNGFQYELVQAFARDHGLQATFLPEMSLEKQMGGLAKGEYDLIAGLLATSQLKDTLLLSGATAFNKQVLVQREPSSIDDSTYVKSLLELAGKTLHVAKGSPSILRIHNLAGEIGDTIYIQEVEKYGQEQLVAMVAHGDIDYAVCDESIAQSLTDSLPQIDIHTPISFTQFYAWGVSKQSPALLDSINGWLQQFKQGKEYKQLYRKYYSLER